MTWTTSSYWTPLESAAYPKKSHGSCHTDLITLDGLDTIRDAARVLASKEIEGAPVMDDDEVIGW